MNSRKEETLRKDPSVGDPTLSRNQAPCRMSENWGSSLLPCRSLSTARGLEVPQLTDFLLSQASNLGLWSFSSSYPGARMYSHLRKGGIAQGVPPLPPPCFVLRSGNSLAPISQVRKVEACLMSPHLSDSRLLIL